jgi:cytochrome c-type biogenesis protein CcmH/NrfF
MGSLRARAAWALVLVSLWLPAAAAHAQPKLSQREIEESLTCQCGCGLTVGSCNHLECSFAVPVRKDITESLARGETGEQIIDRYKQKYGEKVLSSPIPEGFNLLAWIAPYAAILIAGTAMFTFFRRRAVAAAPDNVPASVDPAHDPAADSSRNPAGDPKQDERIAQLQRDVEELER